MFVIYALLLGCAGVGCVGVVMFAREEASQKMGTVMAVLFFMAALACLVLNMGAS